MKKYDVIVVGIGSMGSAAAYYLAKAGKSVLGIEQFDVPNQMGSHHGETRIIRFAYDEGEYYIDMALHARTLWQNIEKESGQKLYHPVGGLYITHPDCNRFYDAPVKAAVDRGFEHELLTGREINKRFPAFKLPEDYRAFFEKASGYLLCNQAVKTMAELAILNGADILQQTSTQNIEFKDDEVCVYTDKGNFSAEKIVMTTGAWSRDLIPDLQHHIKISRNVICWFKPENDGPHYDSLNMPIFTLADANGTAYGFGRQEIQGIKIGIHDEFNYVDLETLDRSVSNTDQDRLREYVGQYFDLGQADIIHSSVCLYSMTPDHDFIIGAHPDHARMIMATGFSGHGFKFAPTVGEILKDLVLEKPPAFDLTPFRPDRFS